MITQFRDEHAFLSNMFPVEIDYMGHKFPSVENAYQAMKCADPKQYSMFETVSPPQAKKLGKCVKLCSDWEQCKYEIMKDLLDIKFKNKELMYKLHATAPETLIEKNRWHDNYWGWCTCERCRDKIHHNHLGELLQRKRNLTIPKPDVYTMYCGSIYHRDERLCISRPAMVYDKDTYTLLRIGNYDWCMGYLEVLRSKDPSGTINAECLEFDIRKMSMHAICEVMNRCLEYTGYVGNFITGKEYVSE